MQTFRLEFSTQGGCYDFLVRAKDRCEEFLSYFIGKLSLYSNVSSVFSLFTSAPNRNESYRAGYALMAQSFSSLISRFLDHADVVQQAQSNAGSRPVVVMPPHPQTLQHIR